MVVLIGVLFLMIPCTITDIREMKVPTWFIVVFTILAFLINLFFKTISLPFVLMGMFVGILFILGSFLSHRALAYGDSLMILALGVWCGGRSLILILLLGFLLAAIIGTIKKLILKTQWNQRMPLAPFLGISAATVCTMNWLC